ncbi:hypothetical protein TEA_013956 [Camellia sinensis var. sinensis]|uniref:Uncharacterized protein n=1 Tax=Camellia sinensis var. sinensis TaxID=542762 RepID=A0A4S4DKL1_CAMSN|nr:hypothetical protein TEA_013956 [Camellia sinensis var. sinensis]
MTNVMKAATINASGSGSKRRHSSVTAVQKKKRITGAEALATSMDDLVNSVKTQSKELTVNHVVCGQSVTMAEVVGRIYEIQGLDQSNPLLHFGISLMEVPNNKEMVMSIPSDAGIIGWLQVKQQDREDDNSSNSCKHIAQSRTSFLTMLCVRLLIRYVLDFFSLMRWTSFLTMLCVALLMRYVLDFFSLMRWTSFLTMLMC